MDFQSYKSIIEGLLFMAGEDGLNARQIAEILQIDVQTSAELVYDLKCDLKREGRGVQITEVAGAYRMTTHPEHAVYYERMAYSPARASLSQAALETLSIVAYRQPITRVDIEEIRGVKSDRAIHSLVSKDLIEEVGRAEAIGRPILYGTTKAFLDYFGLSALSALPEPANVTIDDLEEGSNMLFERFDGRQMTFDELPPIPAAPQEIAVAKEDEE